MSHVDGRWILLGLLLSLVDIDQVFEQYFLVIQLSGTLLLQHIFLLLVIKLLQLLVNLFRVDVLDIQVWLDILLLVSLHLLELELV